MSAQTRTRISDFQSELNLSRETEELLIVAEGFVSNAWRIIAGEIGILPQVSHELSPSTMAQLGELATHFIPDYSHFEISQDHI